MLGFHEIDMMVHGGSLALLALWSWLLVRDHWHALPARMAVAMNASIACHVIAVIPGPPGFGFLLDWVVEVGSVSVPVFFWLFTRTWFNDEQSVGWRSWALVPVGALLLVGVESNFDAKNLLFYVSATVLRVFTTSLAIAALWVAWRGREDDLVEQRRRIRLLLIGAVGAFTLVTNAIEVAVYNDLLSEQWRSLLQVGVLALTFALCAIMFGIRQPDLLGPAQRTSGSIAPVGTDDDPLAGRLLAHMDAERPYRDETMTIAKLANELGEPEYRLRRLINGRMGHRNFAAFLNGYRLNEVKLALADPEQRQVPILTIALDAGFGSLGPFNRAFREAEGMTPTEYRARKA